MDIQKNITRSKELVEYYRSIDFSFWWEELQCLQDQKIKADKEEDSTLKNIHSIKLYSTYLQLSEIFCLNLLAISSNSLGFLFVPNPVFENELKQRFNVDPTERKIFLDFFLDNFVFPIIEKVNISNFGEKRKFYFKILDEAMKDRELDKDLLNAYKHGFRMIGGGYIHLKAFSGLQITPEYDAMITYYAGVRGNTKTKGFVFEHKISFFSERVYIKCHFILNMLENAKKVLSAKEGELITIDTLKIDKDFLEVFDKSFGVFRWKNAKFKFVDTGK